MKRQGPRRKVDFTKTGWPVKHGTRGAYSNHGCRCDDCTDDFSAKHLEYLHRSGRHMSAEAWEIVRPKPRHGGLTKYNRGCRCDECRAAATSHRREARRKARLRPTPDHVHGTVNGYQNYGCRCEECRSAERSARRGRR